MRYTINMICKYCNSSNIGDQFITRFKSITMCVKNSFNVFLSKYIILNYSLIQYR